MLDLPGLWLESADRALLRQPQVGGLILFARNTESPRQVRELVRSIRAVRPDMLIAIDQEGGRVQRLRRGVQRLPALADIARKGGEQAAAAARAAGWLMATEMLACGVDISFAPVLDLDYGRSQVIGNRSLGSHPEQVSFLASAYIDGLTQAGMAATGKHFPGHGWAEADSHFALPVDERSEAQIRDADFKPFALLADRLGGMMPAHVVYSQVDSSPAGFSRYWLQTVLREELGFTGVIFSDDLTMAGAHAVGGIPQRIDAAVTAGCDMLLICNDRGAAEQGLAHAQALKLLPPAGLARMRAERTVPADYKASPEWGEHYSLLRELDLV
ncbi:MAG: beta-N-acetylhexosaminidase [Halopseudomonas sp.]|uniref:beta-N-acetylhexosaminidase n=1 Tax=Halopseudomonas sp. TaxID=2901191 RepID=UPI00300182B9